MVRILVVEDEVLIARELQGRLQEMGYEAPEIAISGAEAVAKASLFAPDLILMDIHLKGELDGVDAAARIRAERSVPVVYLTAYADDETVQRARLTEAFGYLLKPFQARELQTTIEMALYKHQMELKLKQAHDQLQRYVKELEARDRLARFQMSGPTLEEAYNEILAVVEQVLGVEGATFYRPGGEFLEEVASIGQASARSPAGADPSLVQRTFSEGQPQQDGDKREAAVPILYRDQPLGVLWIQSAKGQDEETLNRLWRLGQQAALLLRMARVTEDLESREIEENDLLKLAEEEGDDG